MSNSSTLPNPNVYLNYLSPQRALGWELARDIDLVTCGALIWDILSTIPNDLKFLRRFNTGVLAYGLCRPATLVFVITATITKTSPLPNCQAMTVGTACSSIVAISTSSFLFLLRIQAVYSHSKLVRYAFCVLWLVQLGILVLVPLSLFSGPLYDTGYCLDTGWNKSIILAGSMPPLFDTLVFGFISYRLVTKHANANDDVHSRWRTFLSGKALPQLSKALLQGGQQYYLLTVGANIATVVIGPTLAPKISEMITVIPGVALTSAMACNVHRNLLSEGRRGTEGEPGTAESLGLSFTDILSFLTRSYRSLGASNNTGHIGAQDNIIEVPAADHV